MRGSAGVRIEGFTVSYSCHHLDCRILWRKLKQKGKKRNEETEEIIII